MKHLGQLTQAELAAVVQELYGPLVLYARQLCPWPEDTVQEAFLELQKASFGEPRQIGGEAMGQCVSGPSPGTSPTHVRAWLFRTVRHRALNSKRSQQRRSHYETDYCQQKTWFTTNSQANIEADEAVAAMQSLPDELRETVVARLWGNLNLEQIAALTGVSIATAQRRYIRGLDSLRKRLDREQLQPIAVPRKQP